MEHRSSYYKLGRTTEHRMSMLKNMFSSLVKSEKMVTTLIKAKALRPYAEKLITKAKKSLTASNSLQLNRELRSTSRDDDVFNKLTKEIANKYSTRNGGYLRIVKLGFRKGDKADIALIEFV